MAALLPRSVRCNLKKMPTQTEVPYTFTLSGDYEHEHRVLEVLKVAKHQARLAQGDAAPRMQDALVGLEDALSDQIAWLENAAEDDEAGAEDSGEAEPERCAYYPPRAA
jgi:hypothetical protein